MNFINGTEYGAAGIRNLAHRALALREGAVEPQRFDGARIAAVFLNPSLRTRTSLEVAAGALGIQPVMVSPGKDSWALELRDGVVMDGTAAEHMADAVKVLAEYADVLALRVFARLEDAAEDRADPVLSSFAKHAPVPVINMESALWHPLQGLADTATWLTHLGGLKMDLKGVPLTLTWAPHPKALPAAVANQVLMSAALQGMDVTVVHPPCFDLDPEIIEAARATAGSVTISHDQDAAFKGARVVVAKSWSGFSGYGHRDAEAVLRAAHGDWTVTAEKMALTDNAGFMHCLPVRRNVVVTDAVLDGENSWVHEEAGLRMWTTMALLERILGEA
jgi:N-acetylornithine carbamoyltransferase